MRLGSFYYASTTSYSRTWLIDGILCVPVLTSGKLTYLLAVVTEIAKAYAWALGAAMKTYLPKLCKSQLTHWCVTI